MAIILLFFFIHVICSYRASICDSKVEFTELLGMDFVDVEITDIQYKNFWEWENGEYTHIYAFLKESDEKLQSREYYNRDWNEDQHIPIGHIEIFEELGISVENVQRIGINYKECLEYPLYPIKFVGGYWPYNIYWYQLDENNGDRGNILLIASIPCRITVKVDKIMQD